MSLIKFRIPHCLCSKYLKSAGREEEVAAKKRRKNNVGTSTSVGEQDGAPLGNADDVW